MIFRCFFCYVSQFEQDFKIGNILIFFALITGNALNVLSNLGHKDSERIEELKHDC